MLVVIACCLTVFAAAALPQRAAADPTAQIVNGSIVPNDASQWPYIAALVTASDFQFCGGTLVAPTWVATAAHCGGGTDAVIIGRKKLSGVGGERIDVIASYPHPSYNSSTHVNDIQLLKLAHSPAGAQPIAVALPGEDVPDGTTVMVAGWGTTSYGAPDTSDDLLQAPVEVIGNAECDSDYGGGLIVASEICAAHFEPGNNRDTCQGDSGGPLVANTVNGPRFAGITSFGFQCAVSNYPGVYTRVSSFNSWVASKIGPAVSFESTGHDFGSVAIGSPVTATFTVHSTGTGAVAITGASVLGGAGFSIVSDQCASAGSLSVGATCQISVQYSPSSVGAGVGILKLATNSATDPAAAIVLFGNAYFVPPIPKLRIVQDGKAAKRGDKIRVKVKAYYTPPDGADVTVACGNTIDLSAKLPGVARPILTRAGVHHSGSHCVARMKMRMPRRMKLRLVAFSMSSPGNAVLASAADAESLRIR
ncbi:MAG: trypsin-like serine protease [Solirubrobacterales bacterium]